MDMDMVTDMNSMEILRQEDCYEIICTSGTIQEPLTKFIKWGEKVFHWD